MVGEGRIRAARFPGRKSLEEFDFDHARGLKRDVIAHLGAFYRCYAPEVVPLRALVRVAGRRWTVEESFQAGKAWPGSTSTRSGAGLRGNAGPCLRWLRTLYSRSSPPANTPCTPRLTV
jgi:hypothetical protein